MSKNDFVLSMQKVKKSYTQGEKKLHILKGASLDIKEGETVALLGPSGCGKSTFLQIAGLLDRADSGKVIINGRDCAKEGDKVWTSVRRQDIGFVYQFHHLLSEFTALENVVIPQMILGIKKSEAESRGREVLKFLGLEKREEHRPSELSGGEQQRVAIARAIVNKPSLLLADEPTGNLDPKTSGDVFDVLLKTAEGIGLSILMVTHNHTLAKKMKRIVTLEDGEIR